MVHLNTFFESDKFHYKSQLVIIVKFYLPGNWAFWSVALFFALRLASRFTYQQLIHISCGLVPTESPKKKFHRKMTPSISVIDKIYVASSALVRDASGRRDDSLACFSLSPAALARSMNNSSVGIPPCSYLLDHCAGIAEF